MEESAESLNLTVSETLRMWNHLHGTPNQCHCTTPAPADANNALSPQPRSAPPLLLLALPLAAGLQHRLGVIDLAVLPRESDLGAILACAEVTTVDDQTLLATLHFKNKLANRSIGDSIKSGANATINRVDKADQNDVDLTI